MKAFKTAAIAAAFALTGAAAQAATLYADSVISFTQGAVTAPAPFPGRDDPNAALGAPDATFTSGFVSLGVGGELVLGFAAPFVAPGSVLEITRGNTATHLEKVEVYVGNGGPWTFVALLTNTAAVSGAVFDGFVGEFTQVRLLDVSDFADGTFDGFDVDSVKVTAAPIPLPAGGLLLLTALGAGALLRRRKA